MVPRHTIRLIVYFSIIAAIVYVALMLYRNHFENLENAVEDGAMAPAEVARREIGYKATVASDAQKVQTDQDVTIADGSKLMSVFLNHRVSPFCCNSAYSTSRGCICDILADPVKFDTFADTGSGNGYIQHSLLI